MLLDIVETFWVAISVERLLLLDYCPQVVSGPEFVIQPYPFCDDCCAQLESIPKID